MKALTFKLTTNEVNIILEALGNQPYIKVYELIGSLRSQAEQQLNESLEKPENSKRKVPEIKAKKEDVILQN